MASATDLLRLLEPTVRPAGLPGAATLPTSAAESGRSFEALLAEKTAVPGSASAPATPLPGTPVAEDLPHSANAVGGNLATPLAALAGIDRVENPALRSILGRHAA